MRDRVNERKQSAEDTLRLMEQGVYNRMRPSADIIEELIEVILLLANKL